MENKEYRDWMEDNFTWSPRQNKHPWANLLIEKGGEGWKGDSPRHWYKESWPEATGDMLTAAQEVLNEIR